MKLGAVILIFLFTAGAALGHPYRIAHGDRITVSVLLNGKGPFDFVVDTASSRTVLFDHVRASLGLAAEEGVAMTIYGMIGEKGATAVKLDSLGIGEETVHGVEVADLPDPAPGDDEADGIIGLDILEKYALLFDRPSRTLRLFARPAALPGSLAGWTKVPLRHQRLDKVPCAFWFLGVDLGRSASAALLDTGAGLTIINWLMAEDLGVRKSRFITPDPKAELKDLFGQAAPIVQLTEVPIRIGRSLWPAEKVIISDSKIFEILGLDGVPSTIIGSGLLKDSSFAIDFRSQTLYVATDTGPYLD